MKLTPNDVFLTVDKLPWEELYGGKYVKQAIRQLVNQNPKKRDEALNQLDNVLVIQSSLFEAAFYLTPFLIALLDTDVIYGREEITDILYEIGNGGADYIQRVTYRIEYEPFIYYRKAETGIEQNLEIACRSAVLLGLDSYYREIFNVQSDARINCADLISSFIEHSPPITYFLLDVIAYEKDQANVDFYNNIIKAVSYKRDVSKFTLEHKHYG